MPKKLFVYPILNKYISLEMQCKSIGIISSHYDPCIIDVYDWIIHLGHKCSIIDDYYSTSWKMTIQDGNISNTFNYVHFDSLWFRKSPSVSFPFDIYDENLSIALQTEYHELLKSLYFFTQTNDRCYILGTCKAGYIEVPKVYILSIASKIGLKVPNSIVTNSRVELLNFVKNYTYTICKPILNAFTYKPNQGNDIYYFYNSKVEYAQYCHSNSFAFPLLVQEYVNKLFEIRAFVIENQIYSYAIFSQLDPQTESDFRNYNYSSINRIVPYKLPDDICNKIFKLFEYFGYNTGSIDIIMSNNNEYIFLETNPVGQFGMFSELCNTNLPFIIAKHLVENAK